jgi:hypothetical protein
MVNNGFMVPICLTGPVSEHPGAKGCRGKHLKSSVWRIFAGGETEYFKARLTSDSSPPGEEDSKRTVLAFRRRVRLIQRLDSHGAVGVFWGV